MKTWMNLLTMIILSGALTGGCREDEDNNMNDLENDTIKTSITDSLEGNWSWYATYHPKKGLLESEHQLSVTFDETGNDSILNYETFAQDTLFKNGRITISRHSIHRIKITPDILPFFNPTNSRFLGFRSIDTIQMHIFGEDVNDYFFHRVK